MHLGPPPTGESQHHDAFASNESRLGLRRTGVVRSLSVLGAGTPVSISNRWTGSTPPYKPQSVVATIFVCPLRLSVSTVWDSMRRASSRHSRRTGHVEQIDLARSKSAR